MKVQLKAPPSIYLFIATTSAFLFIFLVSLPGLAGVSDVTNDTAQSTNTQTASPTMGQPGDNISPSSTPTSFITQIIAITDTQTSTPTYTASPTFTSTPGPILLESPSPYPTQLSYLPNLLKQHFIPTYTPTPTPPPPETVLFCDDLAHPVSIPDDNIDGTNSDIVVNDGRVLVNARLYLDISHSWVGDLVVKLTHQDTGEVIRVLDRPGDPPYGCGYNDIVAILDDAAAQPANDKCASYPHAISGIYLPNESFKVFSGDGVSGTWRLNVSDRYPNDTGTLNHWCLATELSEAMPAPTPTPTPVALPSSASIGGMSGQNQQLSLDCESRSAVDWARHFGYFIDEISFLNNLPHSDDPEVGFVGNPNGSLGNIPPGDYGVHAPPVASLLRAYGLTANSFRSIQWDDLRAEIAGGNPAIVWIIAGSNYGLANGTPHYYTAASTGNTTIVAPWEHTVILVGYTPTDVTILNGSRFITVPLTQFLDSWSVLDFMAVLSRP